MASAQGLLIFALRPRAHMHITHLTRQQIKTGGQRRRPSCCDQCSRQIFLPLILANAKVHMETHSLEEGIHQPGAAQPGTHSTCINNCMCHFFHVYVAFFDTHTYTQNRADTSSKFPPCSFQRRKEQGIDLPGHDPKGLYVQQLAARAGELQQTSLRKRIWMHAAAMKPPNQPNHQQTRSISKKRRTRSQL